MPSATTKYDAANVALGDLVLHLRASLKALTAPQTSTQLASGLHDTEKLPDRFLTQQASEAVDLLSELEKLLQPAHLVLADHFLGYTDTKCLLAAVELNLPDILAKKSLNVQDLADESGARADRLVQILRPLRNNGIFDFDAASEQYSNTHVAELLRSDHWTQWRNWVDLYGDVFYDIARGIPESVRKDATRSAAQINFDTDLNMFEYFNASGWVPRLHRTLGGGAVAMGPGILADYPWEEVADKTVLDIGGGSGGFISMLLRKHSSMRGSIYDLPHVISHASDLFSKGGACEDLIDRVPQANLIGGDFFTWVPPSEVYTMKWCLHDWNDEECETILRNIKDALVPGKESRLIVLESILSDGKVGRLSRYGDINMAMTAKGQERTEETWRRLIGNAGWRLEKIHPMRNSWVQALDLRPVA
ncbi:hypothetical protein CKM354_000379200 [Cercospora kikuchii]|uniref:O-methyltransferase n=1 Tax=Cercospora kikuchii TaxID=84275 RepID=A0A9P3FFG0_9PEZI|nr:uncharacterized protein CKM354_000379200 [Cercospora kikuchii]GIZ40455.1 hypothetical protein CKM354_000379200 [Cercospora kikuchii]